MNIPQGIENSSIVFTNHAFTCGLYNSEFRVPLDYDNKINLGNSSSRWLKVYATSGTIGTSDERDKNIIGNVDERYKKLYMTLETILYRWKDENIDNKVHIGLSAQQTERKAIEYGILPSENGMIEHDYWSEPDKDGRVDRYGMNYQEVSMLTIPMVPEHESKLLIFEQKIKEQDEELNLLKTELRELKELVKN